MHHITHSFLYRIVVICVIFTLLFSTGCTAQPAPADRLPATASNPENVTKSQDGEDSAVDVPAIEEPEIDIEDIEVNFVEDFQLVRYTSEPLGSVSFREDPDAAVERALTPADEDVELQVMDGAGLTWTLKIPAHALDRLVTVRMIPLTDLDGSTVSDTAGVVTGGVRLEPDGLNFREPVQLTVTGAGLEGPSLILSGNHAGAEVDYTLQDIESADPTAHILHFSTYFTSVLPDPKIAEMNKKATQEFKNLEAVAKKLRRAPLEVPIPPSIPLDCPDEEAAKVLDQFIKNALEPESNLTAKMLAQWRIIAMTSETTVEGVPELAVGMVMRLTRKATAMIDQYQGSEDKLLAVSAFALKTARMLALLGGDQEMIQHVIDDLGNWNLSLIDKLINEIGKKHNYKRIPTAILVAYHASLLGRGDKTGDFLERLREVMRFEAKVQYSMEDTWAKAHNITEAVVPLQLEPTYGCYGEGTGKPLEAAVDEEGWAIKAYKYPVFIRISEFDPCKGTLVFSIDKFGSDSDTATFKDYSGPWNVSQLSAESLFEAETQDGLFKFVLPIQNGNATIVDHTIERTRDDGILSGSLIIQILHK